MIVVLAWAQGLASLIGVTLTVSQFTFLGTAIWLGYTADRLCDSRCIPPGIPLAPRHRVIRQLEHPLRLIWAAVLTISLLCGFLILDSGKFWSGRLLERAREEHIAALDGCRNILILGEGDGRFLRRLHSVAPRAQVTVVDKSPGMLRTARRRLQRSLGRIPSGWTFICNDFLEWNCPAQAVPFDALVTHFFLDQFQKETQEWIKNAFPRSPNKVNS